MEKLTFSEYLEVEYNYGTTLWVIGITTKETCPACKGVGEVKLGNDFFVNAKGIKNLIQAKNGGL